VSELPGERAAQPEGQGAEKLRGRAVPLRQEAGAESEPLPEVFGEGTEAVAAQEGYPESNVEAG